MTELGYQADNAGSSAKLRLLYNRSIMLIFWNAKEQGVAVVETRRYKGMNQDFGSISR